jgi:hypothetical protein
MDGFIRGIVDLVGLAMRLSAQLFIALIQGLVSVVVALINRPPAPRRAAPKPEDDLETFVRRVMKKPPR